MSEELSPPMPPTPEQCAALLAAMQPFDDPAFCTADERECLAILRAAAQDIARGGTLVPPAEGEPLKVRLLRRVAMSFHHHLSPRPKMAVAQ